MNEEFIKANRDDMEGIDAALEIPVWDNAPIEMDHVYRNEAV